MPSSARAGAEAAVEGGVAEQADDRLAERVGRSEHGVHERAADVGALAVRRDADRPQPDGAVRAPRRARAAYDVAGQAAVAADRDERERRIESPPRAARRAGAARSPRARSGRRQPRDLRDVGTVAPAGSRFRHHGDASSAAGREGVGPRRWSLRREPVRDTDAGACQGGSRVVAAGTAAIRARARFSGARLEENMRRTTTTALAVAGAALAAPAASPCPRHSIRPRPSGTALEVAARRARDGCRRRCGT